MGKINNSQGRKRNSLKRQSIILIPLLLVFFGSSLAFGAVNPPDDQTKNMGNKQMLEKAFKIQMPFIANQGQIADEHVRFYAKTFGGTAYVTDKGEMIYSLSMTESKPPLSTINPRDRHLKPERFVPPSQGPP